jgi:hypothetical protein
VDNDKEGTKAPTCYPAVPSKAQVLDDDDDEAETTKSLSLPSPSTPSDDSFETVTIVILVLMGIGFLVTLASTSHTAATRRDKTTVTSAYQHIRLPQRSSLPNSSVVQHAGSRRGSQAVAVRACANLLSRRAQLAATLFEGRVERLERPHARPRGP